MVHEARCGWGCILFISFNVDDKDRSMLESGSGRSDRPWKRFPQADRIRLGRTGARRPDPRRCPQKGTSMLAASIPTFSIVVASLLGQAGKAGEPPAVPPAPVEAPAAVRSILKLPAD